MLKFTNKKDNLQRNYTFGDILELGWCVLRSKILDRRIRIIRRPFVLRGRKFMILERALLQGTGVVLKYFIKVTTLGNG